MTQLNGSTALLSSLNVMEPIQSSELPSPLFTGGFRSMKAWELFEQELITRFSPTDYEIFDESLSGVKQHGSLRGYQREFERLANQVVG